jgi:hypothetical protein
MIATADEAVLYGPYRVVTVDPEAVRNRSLALEDFGNYGIASDFPGDIPAGTVWVARGLDPLERGVSIGEGLRRLRLERAGEDTDQAYRMALRDSTARRRRLANDLHELPDDVRVAQIGHHDGCVVWLVDGRRVRDLYDPDFIEGGHDLVYRYVGPDEIWIDRDVPVDERPFVVAHEAVERRLMGQGMAYGPAHEQASQHEWRLRQRAVQP